jgi:hypothetical protein
MPTDGWAKETTVLVMKKAIQVTVPVSAPPHTTPNMANKNNPTRWGISRNVMLGKPIKGTENRSTNLSTFHD